MQKIKICLLIRSMRYSYPANIPQVIWDHALQLQSEQRKQLPCDNLHITHCKIFDIF